MGRFPSGAAARARIEANRSRQTGSRPWLVRKAVRRRRINLFDQRDAGLPDRVLCATVSGKRSALRLRFGVAEAAQEPEESVEYGTYGYTSISYPCIGNKYIAKNLYVLHFAYTPRLRQDVRSRTYSQQACRAYLGPTPRNLRLLPLPAVQGGVTWGTADLGLTPGPSLLRKEG